MRDYSSAERAYRTALEREPGGGRAYFGLADALRGLGRIADAEKALGQGRKAWDKADANLPQINGAMRTAAESEGTPRH
jgi:tetratricopeptide (TPR) repeat protein